MVVMTIGAKRRWLEMAASKSDTRESMRNWLVCG